MNTEPIATITTQTPDVRSTLSLRRPGHAATRVRLWAAMTTARTPLWVRGVGLLAWLVTFALAWRAGGLRAYGDALSHELIARRVTDSLNPGLAQLGTVWLPLPSLALVPVVALDPLWRLGIAGALLGAIYLQLAIGALHRAGRLIGGATAGGLAVVVFLANPNTLYLFVAPLTEAPALAFGCLCGAALAEALEGFGRGEVRPGAILRTALAAAATLLCRYDGWMLAVLAGALLGMAALCWLRSWQKAEAVAIFYAVAPLAAIALWIAYNWAIFGDPLAFQRGPYSSAGIVRDLAARGIIPTIDGRPPESGRPLRALLTYGQAVLENTGAVPLALAALGTIVALAQVRRRPVALALVALAAPFAFYLIALTCGQSVIVTHAADPGGLFNVRYGGALAPCVALAVASLAGMLSAHAWRVAVPLAGAVILSGAALLVAPGGPVTIAEGVLQQQGHPAIAGREAGRWLATQPSAGLILLDDALQPQTQALVSDNDRPVRYYVTSSTPDDWATALRQPHANIDWIVTLGPASRDRPNDRVGHALLASGAIAGFVPAFDNGEIVIFRRATLPAGPAANPATSSGAPTMTPLNLGTTLRTALGTVPLGPLGIAALAALIALFIAREALPATGPGRARRWRARLTIAVVPLTALAAIALAARLAMVSVPALVAEFSTTETTRGAAVPATPTVPQVGPTIAAGATQPTATVAPATPTVRATPTGAPATPAIAPAVVRSPQQIATAIGSFRSGQFETQIAYANGTTSTVSMRFDLGDGAQPARLYSSTTFQGATGGRTAEQIVIGRQVWTRDNGADWVIASTGQPVQEEVGALLPTTSALLTATATGQPAALRWYDATRDADARLETDPITGTPRRMQQTTRGTGTVLTVVYRGWNTPVEITPPTGQ